MLNHGLTRPQQDPGATEREFVRDIEVFVAGTIAATTPPSTPASLIDRAWELVGNHTDWLYWGPSGMPLTGEQIAAHAETAAGTLRTAGWNPAYTARRGIRDALIHAEDTDPERRFSHDTHNALDNIFELLIRSLTGAPHANYETWDRHPIRRVEEVFGLLNAAAVFARTHGTLTPTPAPPAA